MKENFCGSALDNKGLAGTQSDEMVSHLQANMYECAVLNVCLIHGRS